MIHCDKCNDTGYDFTPYSEQVCCTCPIGVALDLAWNETPAGEEAALSIEKMAEFMRDPTPSTSPPPVCTGTGTIQADFTPMATSMWNMGLCGICGHQVRLIANGLGGLLIATHPYRPSPTKG